VSVLQKPVVGRAANRGRTAAERAFAARREAVGDPLLPVTRSFRLPSGGTYQPDFFSPRDGIFYEVANRPAGAFLHIFQFQEFRKAGWCLKVVHPNGDPWYWEGICPGWGIRVRGREWRDAWADFTEGDTWRRYWKRGT
jgi:hypothetical protein